MSKKEEILNNLDIVEKKLSNEAKEIEKEVLDDSEKKATVSVQAPKVEKLSQEDLSKRVVFLEQKLDSIAKALTEHHAHLKGVVHHGFTRMEAVLNILSEKDIVNEDGLRRGYKRVTEYQVKINEVLSGREPMKNKIEKVHKWNEDENRIPIRMTDIGLPAYLIKNPDNLTLDERIELAKRGDLDSQVFTMLAQENLSKKSPTEVSTGSGVVDMSHKVDMEIVKEKKSEKKAENQEDPIDN